ncbi:SLAIN motif-containing protein 1-like [Xyrauchen texanus]|uniref:SLAIN motif-containing protein 1-like n=1 Tax=Xyrauchen texanus TaxID=154827 RepID=UPI002241B34E|nr:SLAIN motif-containing protein 1-like [Xyrauchen texanus]
MEAALLQPQDARAEQEVLKLQELVRKLERQNEQLRTRVNIAPLASSCCIPSPKPSLACQYEPFPYYQPSVTDDEDDDDEEEACESRALLDELEILDLEKIFPNISESEETWMNSPRSPIERYLYCLFQAVCVSRSHVWSGAGKSALQWCRQVLDQQRSDVDTNRHTHGQRLESVNRWRSGVTSPARPHTRVVGISPLGSSCKPCDRAGVWSQCSVDSDVDEDYKPQDLSDVQVMARLQEESLRQDYATTSSSSVQNRRSSSFTFLFSQRDDSNLDDDDDDDDEDYGQLPPPQPRLSRAGAIHRGLPHSHTFNTIRDWTCGLIASTPPYTPTAPVSPQTSANTPVSSHEHTGLRSSSDKLRRSMPNLLRAPSVTSVLVPANQMTSAPSIRNSQSFDSSSALTRLQTAIPSPAQLQNRVQSVGNFSSRPTLKATAYVSPTIKSSSLMTSSASLQSLFSSSSKTSGSQIPARSALPRPASFIATVSNRSKLNTPVRSLLTPPKSLVTLSALRDGSWRDGCY